MPKHILAHVLLFIVALLYGANYSVAKGVMPEFIQPFGFIFIRVVGASILFWAILIFRFEKIQKSDWLRIAACGLTGVACNQLLFFQGLSLTSPIDAAIIMTSNPILVLILSAIILKNRITKRKIAGIALGLIGAIWLIISGANAADSGSDLVGNLCIFLNATSYAFYLVLVKPLMSRYKPLTVITYVFTAGLLIVVPVGWSQFGDIDFASFPSWTWWAVAYVVIGVTFGVYLLNVYAIQFVQPSVVSTYVYLQPLLATLFATFAGQSNLNWVHFAAGALIFAGVYLVSKPVASR